MIQHSHTKAALKVIPVLLAVLSLSFGCCSTPPEVTELSKSTMEQTRFLLEGQNESLAAFEQFTKDAEQHHQELAALTKELKNRMASLALRWIQARMEAEEGKLLNQFDNQAWKILTVDFDKALEDHFYPTVNDLLKQESDKAKELYEEASANHEDFLVMEKYLKQDLRFQHMNKLVAIEVDSKRSKLNQDLAKARGEIIAEIQEKFSALEEQIRNPTETSSLINLLGPVESERENEKEQWAAYANVRKQVQDYRSRMDPLWQLHGESQRAIYDYLTRKSAVSLILEGAWDNTKETILEEAGDLMDMLPLPPVVRDVMDAKLTETLCNAEAGIMREATDMEKRIKEKLDASFNKVIKVSANLVNSFNNKTPDKE